MATVVRTRGKVFLLGEYAVLFGHPCIVCSVDATLEVRVEAGKKKGLAIRSMRWLEPEFFSWEDHVKLSGQNIFAAVMSVWQRTNREKPAWQVTVTGNLHSEYGLGSSAALTVGLIKALWKHEGHPVDRSRLWQLSCEAMRLFQPENSCADVACAIAGKSIYFHAGKTQTLSVPFPLAIYYSGSGVATHKIVPRIKKRLARKTNVLALLNALTALGKRAIQAKNEVTLGKCMLLYHAALAPLGWSNDGLEAQYQKLLKNSRAAKLSGAGGGDCFIALGGRALSSPRKLPFKIR